MMPTLFKIGSFEIRIYSLMILISLFTAIFFVRRRAKQIGIKEDVIENIMIIVFVAGILGARIYYVIFQWDYFKHDLLEIFAVWHGGLAIHGGIIAGGIAFYFVSKKYKIPFFTATDLILPFVLFGQGLGRIGNFANGEAHGVPTITPPNVIFSIKPEFTHFWQSFLTKENIANTPQALSIFWEKLKVVSINFVYDGKDYLIHEYVPWGVSFTNKVAAPAYREFGNLPVHPTFFYEMILNILGAQLLILLFWRKDSSIGKGTITALYILFYGLIRGFVTFFRADDLMFGAFRAPHIISFLLLVFAAVIFWFTHKKQKI